MLIQERIQLILKMHALTPSMFADKLGVQRSNISHILSGRSKPSFDFLEKVVVNFPRVNANWLLTGEMKENATEIKPLKPSNNESFQQKEIVKIIEFYNDDSIKVYFTKNE
jgi:transcriptional regulator with XRE-family HTH domain